MDEKKLVFKNAKFIFLGNLKNKNKIPEFGIVVPEVEASDLAKAGWNIRVLSGWGRTTNVTLSYIMVAIPKGAYAPPLLTEVYDGTLDVTVRGYDWQVQHLSGTKAFLESVSYSSPLRAEVN